MRQRTTYIVLFFAVIFALFAMFGNDSYSNLSRLRDRHVAQTEYTAEIQNKVQQLQKKITGIQSDDRYLERYARDELGLAGDQELIFIFDDEQE